MRDAAARGTVPGAVPLLEASGLEVSYRGVTAVRGIDISVGAGEVVGLIGPNGAGKSSTLAALMGLVRPRRGDVRLCGESILGCAPEQRARRGIALVPEGRHIYAALTVAENMRLGGFARDGHVPSDELEAVYDLFPVVREMAHRRAGLLSGGQQQQLAIARALVSSPRLLMLDEPSLGLAPKVVETVFAALAEIRRRGVGILLVEQRAALTVDFAERTHVMRDGEIALTVLPGAVTDVSTLTNAYFGT